MSIFGGKYNTRCRLCKARQNYFWSGVGNTQSALYSHRFHNPAASVQIWLDVGARRGMGQRNEGSHEHNAGRLRSYDDRQHAVRREGMGRCDYSARLVWAGQLPPVLYRMLAQPTCRRLLRPMPFPVMSKSLPWILVAVLLVAYALSMYLSRLSYEKQFQDLMNATDKAIDIADSLRTVNAQLSDSVEFHKSIASKANAIADSLKKTDPQVIVDERVKLNRYATAEKVGEGLVKNLP